MTSLNKSFARISSSPISAPPWPSHFSGTAVTRTRTYSTSGPTARPTLPGSVQGVVVQARIEASVSSNLNLTYTDGSSTSLYPRATSWLEYEVPVCGQYGRTLCPLYSKPFSNICLSAHQHDSMYSLCRVTYGSSRSHQ